MKQFCIRTVLSFTLLLVGGSAFSAGPRVSVIGDSISSYRKVSIYPAHYPARDVTDVSKTWWMRVINGLNGTLEVNAAWTGTLVCRRGSKDTFRAMCDEHRLSAIGNPDVVLVYGGTNDARSGVPLGDDVDNIYDPSSWTEANLAKFRPAFAFMLNWLKVNRPDATVVVVINGDIDREEICTAKRWKLFADSLEEIAAHYGATSVRLRDIEKYEEVCNNVLYRVHPSAAGMAATAEQVLAAISWLPGQRKTSLLRICTRDVPRVDALDGGLWASSEWISVVGAPVAGEDEKKHHRAADGTSVFRHRHVNAKAVKSAKWMATGLGVFDLYVNGGAPLGRDFLKPGFTHFAKMKRSFTYADGSIEVVGTKASEWQGCVAGPVLHAGIFDGEEFDAREVNAARNPSLPFQPGGCERSEEFRGEILPSEGAEIVLREDLTEKRNMVGRNLVVKPGKAVVVDFGQNCAAVPFFEFRAKRGTVLTALPGEMLNDADKGVHGCDGPKGSVYRANLRIPNDGMRVVYTFAGDGWEKYLPRFTYFGYRYVSITATDEVEVRRVESLPVTSIAKEMETGRIETGVADLNKFFANVYWTQLSNFLSAPTDCPQRNERLGWGADAQIYSEAGAYVADTSRFYRKWTRDVRDGRCKDGGYPSAAPQGPWGQETFNFGWADAGVIVPWTVWKMFDDRGILEENYEAMAKFVRKLDETRYDFEDKLDYIWADWLSCETFESCGNAYGNFYGKWKRDPDARNYRLYLAACHWLNGARMMAQMAEACGRADDAAWFRCSAERALAYIRGRFLESDGMLLKPMRHLQTACVFALHFGIVEGQARKATLELLTKSIHEHGDFMLTGILGTRYLLDALAEYGETELCYTLLLQRGNPSWLHSVGLGSTTVWERCDGFTKERGFGPVGMNSYNHYAFGAVIAWVYRTAAGIAADPEKPGFRNIIMAPKPDRRLGYVKAEYRSRAGLVKSHWRYDGPRWIWDFTVPEGATASVTLPGETNVKNYSAGTYHIDIPNRRFDKETNQECRVDEMKLAPFSQIAMVDIAVYKVMNAPCARLPTARKTMRPAPD